MRQEIITPGIRSALAAAFLSLIASGPAAGDEVEVAYSKKTKEQIGLAALFEAISPAIVGIDAWSRSAAPNLQNSFGTGTIIDPTGLILTSTTVVPEAVEKIQVYLRGGKILEARKALIVPEMELALIRIAPKEWDRRGPFPFLRLGRSSALRVGEFVLALGNGFHSIDEDDQVTFSAGVLSGGYTLLEKRDESQYLGPALETTSAVNDGMDGGPLVNCRGEIVGLLSLNFSPERWLGTAVPIDLLKPHLADELGWFGDRILGMRARLGVEVMPERACPAGSRGPPGKVPERDSQAPVVAAVEGPSPALEAGIEEGERIASWGGAPVATVKDFRSRFEKALPGERIKLGLEKGGVKREVEVRLWGRY